MVTQQCPACDASVAGGDSYCEACGHDLQGPAPRQPRADLVGHWVSSAGAPTSCGGCGGVHIGVEGFCDDCGRRLPAAQNHSELDLDGIAAVTDRGNRHQHNEDAVGLAVLPGIVLAVVCDGVSTSTRPDTASQAAIAAATPALVTGMQRRTGTGTGAGAGTEAGAGTGTGAAAAIGVAARAAQAAVALVAGPEPGPNPPSSTFVCAVIADGVVTVGWIGDSRAYWLPSTEDGAVCLTIDDAVPGGLLRWLGADAKDTEPHLRLFTPPGSGWILVCSDGLFKYWPEATELAAMMPGRPGSVTPADAATPLAIAQALVRLAVEAGGQDNITAAVLPYPTRGAE